MRDPIERTHAGFRVAAGVFDFFGVALATVCIIGLMVIMASLYSWLRQDLNTTFADIGKNLNEAVVIEVTANP